jgi:hypothetical protein
MCDQLHVFVFLFNIFIIYGINSQTNTSLNQSIKCKHINYCVSTDCHLAIDSFIAISDIGRTNCEKFLEILNGSRAFSLVRRFGFHRSLNEEFSEFELNFDKSRALSSTHSLTVSYL